MAMIESNPIPHCLLGTWRALVLLLVGIYTDYYDVIEGQVSFSGDAQLKFS